MLCHVITTCRHSSANVPIRGILCFIFLSMHFSVGIVTHYYELRGEWLIECVNSTYTSFCFYVICFILYTSVLLRSLALQNGLCKEFGRSNCLEYAARLFVGVRGVQQSNQTWTMTIGTVPAGTRKASVFSTLLDAPHHHSILEPTYAIRLSAVTVTDMISRNEVSPHHILNYSIDENNSKP